jgi:hypothetical protein
METTTATTVNYVYGTELTNKVIETVNKIKNIIDEYNDLRNLDERLQVISNKKGIEFTNKQGMYFDSITRIVIDLSKSKQKKLNKLIYNIEYRNNGKIHLKSINKFLHFLCVDVLKTEGRIKIDLPIKVQNISKAKKEFKEAQKKADLALKAYKELKGDYFKTNKMIV